MKNILIIGPSWIGDMVMSQSLYMTLKENNPNSTIDVIAPGWCKPILERMPEVNNVIEMPLGHGEFSLKERYKIGKKLRTNNYDYAYVLPNSAKSALIPWFAHIPNRIGWKGEFRYGLLTDLRSNKQNFQYMVERYVALAYPKEQMLDSSALGGLSSIPKPSLYINKERQNKTLDKFSLNTNSDCIALCPGAEFGPAKKWPEKYYAQVASYAASKGKQIWLFGSNKDLDTCNKIRSLVNEQYQPQVTVLAGRTSLIEAVDLLAVCSSVVSNDSGLMHVAASVGCHVIAIYGSTSPKYTPPLSNHIDIVEENIDCRPCFKRECPLKHLKCLKELQPERIIQCLEAMEH